MTYTGSTSINTGVNSGAGMIKLLIDDAFPTATVMTFNTATDGFAGPSPLELNGHSQTIAGLAVGNGTGTLPAIIRNSVAGTTSVLTVSGAGSTTYSGQLIDSGGTLALTKAGAGTLMLSGNNTYTGPTTVQGGALILKGSGAQNPVLTNSSGTDITSGRIVFDYSGGSTPATQVLSALSSGQIHSSAATSRKGLGYGDNNAASQFTVAYTYFGDANLDGQVTSGDFDTVAANFNLQTGGNWSLGDFNNDGAVNALDFNAVATNYGAAPLGATALSTLVPEPAVVALFGALPILLRYRTRRNARR